MNQQPMNQRVKRHRVRSGEKVMAWLKLKSVGTYRLPFPIQGIAKRPTQKKQSRHPTHIFEADIAGMSVSIACMCINRKPRDICHAASLTALSLC